MKDVRQARFVPVLLAIAAALLLSALSPLRASGSRGPAEQSGMPGAKISSDRPLLVCFGDSLTAGAGVDPLQAYPAILQQRLDEAGYNYRVVNAGISGNTTKDGLERIAEVIAQHPEVVVVEFGGNDGLRGLPVASAEQNLDSMVRQLKRSGARVAVAGITLPPQYGGEYIRRFNAMYPTVASRYHVPLLPFVLQGVYGVDGDMQEDGVHATAQGNRQVAANVERLVTPLLRKPRPAGS